ncbi:MAG: hypothetical protein ABI120_23385, partial [Gemmatimonadaceae bacterium]
SACAKAPVEWMDKTAMSDRHPSPLEFPGAEPFDTTQRDTSKISEFAHTQDLLREAGAMSMLANVMATMSDTTAPAAMGQANTEPGSPALMAMNHAMQMPSASLKLPGQDLGTGEEPIDTLRCARSLRIVNAAERGRVAVWWSRRDKGRVFLVAAWQLAGAAPDGPKSWRGPVNVDTLDQGAGDANAVERGAVGCDRAAPGLAVDGRNGYVHVAYALNAPEGPGVFYAHQMDPRSTFESPIVMMYGDRRMGAARVAVSGDLVAVAFEDPNAPLNHGRIGLAISRSSGHLFEPRVNASKGGHAVDPYVLLRGRSAVVGWSDVDSTANAAAAFRMRRAIVR